MVTILDARYLSEVCLLTVGEMLFLLWSVVSFAMLWIMINIIELCYLTYIFFYCLLDMDEGSNFLREWSKVHD